MFGSNTDTKKKDLTAEEEEEIYPQITQINTDEGKEFHAENAEPRRKR